MNTGSPSSAPIRAPTACAAACARSRSCRPERHDRHDVGRADARVRSLVRAQVDPLGGHCDSCEQRVAELGLGPDQREHRAVVVGIRVHVQQARVCAERRPDRIDRRLVAARTEVWNRLERQHSSYSRSREGVLRPARAGIRRLVARARALRRSGTAPAGTRSSTRSQLSSARSRRQGRSTSPAAPGSSRSIYRATWSGSTRARP